MGANGQVLGDLAIAQYTYPICGAFGKAGSLERRGIYGRTCLEGSIHVTNIDDMVFLFEHALAEAAFGNAPEQGHLAAFKRGSRCLGTGTRILALMAARGRFTMSAADAAADSLLARAAVDVLVNCTQVHYTA